MSQYIFMRPSQFIGSLAGCSIVRGNSLSFQIFRCYFNHLSPTLAAGKSSAILIPIAGDRSCFIFWKLSGCLLCPLLWMDIFFHSILWNVSFHSMCLVGFSIWRLKASVLGNLPARILHHVSLLRFPVSCSRSPFCFISLY